MHFIDDNQTVLLDIARRAIGNGIRTGRSEAPALDALDEALIDPGASFVTLYENGILSGCVGSLAAGRPLASDVAANAFSAAFYDRRFRPMRSSQLAATRIEISVLTPLEPVGAAHEAELLANIRPDVDGLVIEQHDRQATFLPKVWDLYPDPELFLDALKQKAGIRQWSSSVRAFRYQTVSFAEPAHSAHHDQGEGSLPPT